MSYCTLEQLYDISLNREYAAQFEADEPGCLVAALESAYGVMHTYLNTRYDIPITAAAAQPQLRLCQATLARYFLLDRRGMAFNTSAADSYHAQMDWLMKVSSGRLTLPMGDVTTDTISSVGTLTVERVGLTDETGLPFFGMSKLKGF